MRLVTQSTRATIRAATIFAAFTALVFALLVPLAGTAHAATADGYFVFEKDGTEQKVEFGGGTGGDVLLPGFHWIVGETPQAEFHVSCSGDYEADNTARVMLGDPDTKFEVGDTVTIKEAYILWQPNPKNTRECGLQPETARLTIVKQVSNDNDGATEAKDFDIAVGDTSVDLAEDGSPDQATVTLTDLAPDSYTVGENVPEGYELTDIDCGDKGSTDDAEELEITLEAGDNVTCTFTNQDLPGEPEPETSPSPTPTVDTTPDVLDNVDQNVGVLDEVAVADEELAATGGELTGLALLAALIAALGAMLLMATEAAPRAARRKS